MQSDDDLRRENEALRQRIARTEADLEKLDRLRAELLGTVGHELRAPLIAIKSSTATVLGAVSCTAANAGLAYCSSMSLDLLDRSAPHHHRQVPVLELDAADYIVKPFSPTELTARVQAALRRLAERVPYRCRKPLRVRARGRRG